MAKSKKIRVRLKAYEHKMLDLSVQKLVAAVRKTGGNGRWSYSASNGKRSLYGVTCCP